MKYQSVIEAIWEIRNVALCHYRGIAHIQTGTPSLCYSTNASMTYLPPLGHLLHLLLAELLGPSIVGLTGLDGAIRLHHDAAAHLIGVHHLALLLLRLLRTPEGKNVLDSLNHRLTSYRAGFTLDDILVDESGLDGPALRGRLGAELHSSRLPVPRKAWVAMDGRESDADFVAIVGEGSKLVTRVAFDAAGLHGELLQVDKVGARKEALFKPNFQHCEDLAMSGEVVVLGGINIGRDDFYEVREGLVDEVRDHLACAFGDVHEDLVDEEEKGDVASFDAALLGVDAW